MCQHCQCAAEGIGRAAAAAQEGAKLHIGDGNDGRCIGQSELEHAQVNGIGDDHIHRDGGVERGGGDGRLQADGESVTAANNIGEHAATRGQTKG